MGRQSAFLIVTLSVALLAPTAHADKWWYGWKRAGDAAWKNFKKPAVWVPLAGTAVFGLTNADNYVSDRAQENQWIYGSDDGAESAADRIKDVALASMVVSTLAPPTTEDTGPLKRLAVAGMAGTTTWTTTEVLKNWVGRERPDGGDKKSFPSLHTADVANAMQITRRNLHARPLNDRGKMWTDISIYTVEGLQGWARVEQGRHYPSDVLFGIALGNWVAGFFYDWFIDDPETSNLAVHVSPAEDGGVLNISLAF